MPALAISMEKDKINSHNELVSQKSRRVKVMGLLQHLKH